MRSKPSSGRVGGQWLDGRGSRRLRSRRRRLPRRRRLRGRRLRGRRSRSPSAVGYSILADRYDDGPDLDRCLVRVVVDHDREPLLPCRVVVDQAAAHRLGIEAIAERPDEARAVVRALEDEVGGHERTSIRPFAFRMQVMPGSSELVVETSLSWKEWPARRRPDRARRAARRRDDRCPRAPVVPLRSTCPSDRRHASRDGASFPESRPSRRFDPS